jgi:hypothetical protein
MLLPIVVLVPKGLMLLLIEALDLPYVTSVILDGVIQPRDDEQYNCMDVSKSSGHFSYLFNDKMVSCNGRKNAKKKDERES